VLRSTFFEKRLGDRLMSGRGGAMRLDARDLAFKDFDPLAQFVARQRIERLLDQRCQHIVAAAGKVVIVHGASSWSVNSIRARDC
jgi:hypothetical protein